MKHHFSKVNTRRMRLWSCLQGVQDLPCGSAHLGMNAPQVARPVTRSLWSWRRGQGWVGAALCFVTGGTLAVRLPHLGTPDFILNVLAQPVGASSSAVMAPAAPSLPGGLPKPDLSPQHQQGTLRKEGTEGHVSVWLALNQGRKVCRDHVCLQLPATPAFFQQKRTISTRDKAWEQLRAC